jgi:hypothetical protein
VEATREGQSPPDIANDDASQSDTSIAPTNEAQILEAAQLGSAFSPADIENPSSTSGFATVPADSSAERIGLNSTITGIRQRGSGALNSFSNGGSGFFAKAEGFGGFQDGISGANNITNGFSNQLEDPDVFPNGVARLGKTISGFLGKSQEFSGFQDGILGANNITNGFANQLEDPGVFPNGVERLSETIYGFPGKPQGFSGIQDTNGFYNELGNLNCLLNETRDGNLRSQMISIERYTNDHLWNVGGG